MGTFFFKLMNENKTFIIFMFLMFVFRSSFADWNTVPTGSMKPTIVEGDRILVNKLAYDFKLPFSDISIVELSNPERGDIIIFNSKEANNRLVKRVVGIPGDVVKMQHNALTINGKQLSYQAYSFNGNSQDRLESFNDFTHFIRVNNSGSTLSNFSEITVPKGFYLALGDNRDNSADSRVIGLVPRNEIEGRTKSVVMSLDYENYYLPRTERFFHTL